MAQQALVVGLGQFGMAVARSLARRGLEVLAVDLRQDLVDIAAGFATEALALDAADEGAIAQTRPSTRDLAVCAIGEDAKEASIICTAVLRQQGAPRVIARAGDALHARILHLVGAHLVVNPEEEMGDRLANRLVYERIVSDMPLGEDLRVTEFKVPDAFDGRTLEQLALPRQHGVMVVAVRQASGGIVLPKADVTLHQGETLVVVSKEAAISRLLAEVES